MKFNHLNLPEEWKTYFTKYPNGLSILEALIQWVSQVDDMVDVVNNFSLYIDNFIASFDTNLKATAKIILDEMTADGTLADLINLDLLNDLQDQITKNLDDEALSPELYEGSDFVKVQMALDEALDQNKSVKFTRMYDITGHTLMINRPELYYATDRKQLYLIGTGGGIIKNDSGFIFNALYDNTGDINVSNLKFESTAGAGTVVWNGDKIIRIKSQNNQYRNVDTILSAPTLFTQSTYFINEHITGGDGWKFEAKRFLDVLIEACLIEDCENFLRNTEVLSIPGSNSLRIINNLIENLRGDTITLGGSYSLVISNNYIEFNAGYIDLATLAAGYPHIGLIISGNAFYQLPDQILASLPCITIRNINQGSELGNGGAFSSGNVAGSAVLYDLTPMTEVQAYLAGAGDNGIILTPSRYIQLGKTYVTSYASGFVERSYGFRRTFVKQFFISGVLAGASAVVDVPDLGFTLNKYATVNVMVDSEYFSVENIMANPSTNSLKVYLKNTSGSTLNVNPRIVIIDYNLSD